MIAVAVGDEPGAVAIPLYERRLREDCPSVTRIIRVVAKPGAVATPITTGRS